MDPRYLNIGIKSVWNARVISESRMSIFDWKQNWAKYNNRGYGPTFRLLRVQIEVWKIIDFILLGGRGTLMFNVSVVCSYEIKQLHHHSKIASVDLKLFRRGVSRQKKIRPIRLWRFDCRGVVEDYHHVPGQPKKVSCSFFSLLSLQDSYDNDCYTIGKRTSWEII